MKKHFETRLSFAVLASFVCLVGCETVADNGKNAPPIVDSVELKPAPPPMPVERDLSLGPMPKTKPVAHVGERPLPPPQSAFSSRVGNAVAPALSFPETGQLEGITQAHTYALQNKSARGLEWSKSLAQRAILQVKQLPAGMCEAPKERVLNAKGEALYIVPAGMGSDGKARPVNVSVKTYVAQLVKYKAGAFARENSGASILGCAINHCGNQAQIWLCRYK